MCKRSDIISSLTGLFSPASHHLLFSSFTKNVCQLYLNWEKHTPGLCPLVGALWLSSSAGGLPAPSRGWRSTKWYRLGFPGQTWFIVPRFIPAGDRACRAWEDRCGHTCLCRPAHTLVPGSLRLRNSCGCPLAHVQMDKALQMQLISSVCKRESLTEDVLLTWPLLLDVLQPNFWRWWLHLEVMLPRQYL